MLYLVRQTPALVILSKHVDEGIDVQAGLLCAHAKHHTENGLINCLITNVTEIGLIVS